MWYLAVVLLRKLCTSFILPFAFNVFLKYFLVCAQTGSACMCGGSLMKLHYSIGAQGSYNCLDKVW